MTKRAKPRKMPPAPKPCPFCGSNNLRTMFAYSMGGGAAVSAATHCADCDARGPQRSSEEAADRAWDVRVGGGGTDG